MHYFTETATSILQTAAFGPVTANQFGITSKFQFGVNKKAFAAARGLLMVQQSSTANLVNVAIKPNRDFYFNTYRVRYFVYRGIEKSSFFNGIAGSESVNISAGTSFMIRFMQRFNTGNNANPPAKATPTPETLGFTNMVGTTLIQDIFLSTGTVKPYNVLEGEWLGNFSANGGFEIVIDRAKGYDTLDFLRQPETTVVVNTALTAFDQKLGREAIHQFVDPVAFYGLFHEEGVKVNQGGTTTATLTGDDLYTNVLSRFSLNKNRVYLDIRDDDGNAYDLDGSFTASPADNIKAAQGTGGTLTPQRFETQSWPVLWFDQAQTTPADYNVIRFQLRLQQNDNTPLLFISLPEVLGADKEASYLHKEELITSGITDWTREITIKVPNTGSGGSKNNIAYAIRFNYYYKQKIGLDWSEIPTTLLDTIVTMRQNSTLFDGILSELDKRQSYTNVIDAGIATPAQFMVLPDGGKISFRNDTPDRMAVSEEYFHAYQSLVLTTAYEKGKLINREFEAKVFNYIVAQQTGSGYGTTEPPVQTMYDWMFTTYPGNITLTDIRSDVFRAKYLTQADVFSLYYENNNGSFSYRAKNEQYPYGIEAAFQE